MEILKFVAMVLVIWTLVRLYKKGELGEYFRDIGKAAVIASVLLGLFYLLFLRDHI